MKKQYTLLAIAALALSLLSCEKEQTTLAPSSPQVEFTAGQAVDQLSLPLVLFQYSSINLETGEETGWIIDRSGYVKAYRSTRSVGAVPSSENEIWQEAEVNALHISATETITSIGDEELLAQVRKGLSLGNKYLSEPEMDNGANWITGFYAFAQSRSTSNYDISSHNQGCNVTPDYSNPGSSEAKVNRIAIDLSGRINRHGVTATATHLYDWLLALNEGL
ncbi:MAG: hypothetical protein H6573_25520 [Lewinellaceae bacterium]|nr:hypothetical protein [Phaeodactylibacter sp.]MCB0616005.1 hypothetical protein [Phaeodactylibacter sp.]MCB9350839.1 hypothetical protein [Lewinellaceae bacterium]